MRRIPLSMKRTCCAASPRESQWGGFSSAEYRSWTVLVSIRSVASMAGNGRPPPTAQIIAVYGNRGLVSQQTNGRSVLPCFQRNEYSPVTALYQRVVQTTSTLRPSPLAEPSQVGGHYAAVTTWLRAYPMLACCKARSGPKVTRIELPRMTADVTGSLSLEEGCNECLRAETR